MSTCISGAGEYSEHEAGDWCSRCGAFNEAAVVAQRDALVQEAERLRAANQPEPEFEFDLHLTSADRDGYYVTRWDRARSITVRAADVKEAAAKAAKALGDPRSTGTWAARAYWVYKCDAVREVTR